MEMLFICRRFTECMQRHFSVYFSIECSRKGGGSMAKQKAKLIFTFENANTPKAFEHKLQKILIDKLQCSFRESQNAPGRQTEADCK